MPKPIVAIVGRPNVGKSTLFNRIIQRRVAIVEGQPGVTRDRLYSDAEWLGRQFFLVDTGGIELAPTHAFSEQTRLQAEEAVREADVIVFVVDGRAGLTPGDTDVAQLLRQAGKPIVLAVNKIDTGKLHSYVAEFYGLGLSDPVAVSAEHGQGIGDLLDEVIQHFPTLDEEDSKEETSIAVIGRPNVGKSSLVNKLVGEERVIVSDIPGTTRDAIDTIVQLDGHTFRIVDTAGMRRRSRVRESVEHYSVLRALRAAERSDVCLVMIDATEGVTEQDQRIAGVPHEAGKGVVIVVNKWDLIQKTSQTMQEYEARVRMGLSYLQYAPIVFISALTGQRAHRVLDIAHQVTQHATMRVSTGKLNEVLHEAMHLHQPPTHKGKRLRISFITQVGVKPPHFVLFMNEPELFHFSYRRYLESRLREAFGFMGTPIRLTARKQGV